MQKFDFVQHLKVITRELESEYMTLFIQEGLKQYPDGRHVTIQFSDILPVIIKSKANYANLLLDENYNIFLGKTKAEYIYSNEAIAQVVRCMDDGCIYDLFRSKGCLNFYLFHKSLLEALILSETLLLSDLINKGYEESMEEGVLIFQIAIEQESLNSEDYIKILTALQELVKTIGEVLYGKEGEYQTDIILLDSGSDTNLGIKTAAEIAKALFDIFKEVWDYIVNYRFNRQDRKNKTLLDALNVMGVIKNNVEMGVISQEEGQEYRHLIKTRTDKLIGLHVLPKQIAIETHTHTNRHLLECVDVRGVLAEGNEEE